MLCTSWGTVLCVYIIHFLHTGCVCHYFVIAYFNRVTLSSGSPEGKQVSTKKKKKKIQSEHLVSSFCIYRLYTERPLLSEMMWTLSSKKTLKMCYYTCTVTVNIHIFFSHRKGGYHDLEWQGLRNREISYLEELLGLICCSFSPLAWLKGGIRQEAWRTFAAGHISSRSQTPITLSTMIMPSS